MAFALALAWKVQDLAFILRTEAASVLKMKAKSEALVLALALRFWHWLHAAIFMDGYAYLYFLHWSTTTLIY